MPELRRRVAAGGSYAHLVPEGQYTAICGFKPSASRPTGRQMATRHGWRYAHENRRTCPHCEKKRNSLPTET